MSKSVSPVYDALMKPVAEHGRNQFPLDNRQIYSMKAGQITPVKCIHYKPADFFRFKVKDFSLTFPMNTAAFLRGRKEFAFYSVYYNAIWSLYNQYQGTRPDPKTSVFGANIVQGQLKEPRISMLHLLTACWSQFVAYCIKEYGTKYDSSGNPASAQNPSPYGTTAFFLATTFNDYSFGISQTPRWSSVFGSSVQALIYYAPWELNQGTSFNVQTYMTDVVGHDRAYNWLRKLDMLGYGNYYPLFKKCEQAIINLGADINKPLSAQDTTTNFENELISLMSLIFGCTCTFSGPPTAATDIIQKYKNLYPICAYNAIFYHFFRNSYYDLNYNTHDYNLDFMSLISSSSSSYMIADLQDFSLRFLDIEYHQWKKDKFTAVLPDQQFGAVAKLDISNVDIVGIPYGSNTSVPAGTKAEFSYTTDNKLVGIYNGSLRTNSYNIPSAVDVVALKRAEMLQDYRQQLMRAGNKTSDVFRAIYGESPSSEHEDDIVPRFLETFGEDIFVDPIVSTADTGQPVNGNLGDLSARAKIGGESKEFTFNAGGNFGVILALAYIIPQSEYNSYATDKHLDELTPEDHYIPQFENLGLEDIYSDELNCLIVRNYLSSLGKVPRYHHKKTEVDMVHGAFCSRYDTSILNQIGIINPNAEWFGEFNHWVSPRTDLQNRAITLLRDFYVNPSVLDNVFVRAAGPDQADDQFICNTYFDIQATKELSKVGFVSF